MLKNSRPALFFIKIKVKEDLANSLEFITHTLLMNLDQNEDGYFIHGFSKIVDLKIAVQTFKNLLLQKIQRINLFSVGMIHECWFTCPQ